MLEPKFRVWDKRRNRMVYSSQLFMPFREIVYKPYLIYLPSLGFVDSANQTVYLEDIYEYQNHYFFIPKDTNFEILSYVEEDFRDGATILGNRYESPELVKEVKAQYER